MSYEGGGGAQNKLHIKRRKDLSNKIQGELTEEFIEYGLEITKFLVSSISLPEKLQAKLDEGAGMNMLGDMDTYTKMKTADAIENASKSSGGMGGGMEGMMGMAMMQQMMNQTNMMQNQQVQQNQQQGVPPPPPVIQFFVSINGQQQGPFDANALQQMIAGGQLTKETYVWKQDQASWHRIYR